MIFGRLLKMGHLKKICVNVSSILEWIRMTHSLSFYDEPGRLHDLTEQIKSLYNCDANMSGKFNIEDFTELKCSTSMDLAAQLLEIVFDCVTNKTSFWIMLNSELCQKHLMKFKNTTVSIDRIEAIAVCRKVLNITYFIVQNYHVAIPSDSSQALLGLNQMMSNLPLFLEGVIHDSPFIQSYAAGCLMQCLEIIDKVCEDEKVEKPNYSSDFLDIMDAALGFLDDVSEHTDQWMKEREKVERLKELIHELLCHSMSTSQVAVNENDRLIISGKAQLILRNLEIFEADLEKRDVSSAHLLSSALSDNLCSLERAVNTTVLRLVVHMNSMAQQPLKQLVLACKNAEPAEEATIESGLDEQIDNFDSHIDRLMQIGVFAVSCTSDKKKAMQLKSCLASFEAMETELVPCIQNLYANCTSANKRNLRLLLDHWHSEHKQFNKILDSIIDPAAYTEVIKERIRDLIGEFTEAFDSKTCAILLKSIAKVAGTLDAILMESRSQEKCSENKDRLTNFSGLISQDIETCQRHAKKIQRQEDMTDCLKMTCLGKAHSLMNNIDDLWTFLAEQIAIIDDSSLEKSGGVVNGNTTRDYYKLCPDQISPNALTPFIMKGQLLTKDAVFYNTPLRKPVAKTPVCHSKLLTNRPTGSIARSKCFRSSWYTPSSTTKENSHAFPNDTMIASGKSEFRGRKLLELFSSWEDSVGNASVAVVEGVASISVSGVHNTVDSSLLFTPDRIADLIKIEDRIADLKAGKVVQNVS